MKGGKGRIKRTRESIKVGRESIEEKGNKVSVNKLNDLFNQTGGVGGEKRGGRPPK